MRSWCDTLAPSKWRPGLPDKRHERRGRLLCSFSGARAKFTASRRQNAATTAGSLRRHSDTSDRRNSLLRD